MACWKSRLLLEACRVDKEGCAQPMLVGSARVTFLDDFVLLPCVRGRNWRNGQMPGSHASALFFSHDMVLD